MICCCTQNKNTFGFSLPFTLYDEPKGPFVEFKKISTHAGLEAGDVLVCCTKIKDFDAGKKPRQLGFFSFSSCRLRSRKGRDTKRED